MNSQKNTKNTKFYLGSLPGHANKDNVSKFFKKFGKIVDLKLMKDKRTKKCSGFGFLTMKHTQENKSNIMGLQQFLGRDIKVEEFLNGKNLQRKNEEHAKKRLFISNIGKEVTD
jgi:RNA recognition motif-containing protein